MTGIPITVMFIAAALKREIIMKGISIPNFFKNDLTLDKLPKKHQDYIKGQGKKLLLAMKGRDKDARGHKTNIKGGKG